MSRVPWNLGRGPVSICQWSPAEWCTGSAATCRSSEARRAGRCRWPFTRRNCLDASTMPAAHQRSPICPSRQRLTLRAWSRLIEIIDSKLSCQTAAVEGMELARARSSASFHIRRMMTLASGRLWARRAARLVLFSSARRRSGSRCRRWTGWRSRRRCLSTATASCTGLAVAGLSRRLEVRPCGDGMPEHRHAPGNAPHDYSPRIVAALSVQACWTRT